MDGSRPFRSLARAAALTSSVGNHHIETQTRTAETDGERGRRKNVGHTLGGRALTTQGGGGHDVRPVCGTRENGLKNRWKTYGGHARNTTNTRTHARATSVTDSIIARPTTTRSRAQSRSHSWLTLSLDWRDGDWPPTESFHNNFIDSHRRRCWLIPRPRRRASPDAANKENGRGVQPTHSRPIG